MDLFLCYTPLHVLIAEQIIRRHPQERIGLLYLDFNGDPKHATYYQRLSRHAECSRLLALSDRYLTDMACLRKWASELGERCGDDRVRLICGNLKKFHSRYVAYCLGIRDFVTFDDGMENLVSGYLSDLREGPFSRSFFTLFARDCLYPNVLSRCQTHYTIFPLPNVYTNTQYIPLLTGTESTARSRAPLTILLCGAYYEDNLMSLEGERSLYRNIVGRFQVTHYIRHPRERIAKLAGHQLEELSSDRVAEDIVQDLSRSHRVTVVGVYSTALLTLKAVEGIRLINIKIPLDRAVVEIESIFERMSLEQYVL